MTEENQVQDKPKNKIATTGLWFSIIGGSLYIPYILLMSFFLRTIIDIVTVNTFAVILCFLLLFTGFILGIIGLFHKPRKKARITIIISIITIAICGILTFCAMIVH